MSNLLEWTIKDLCYCIDGMMMNLFDCILFIEGRRGLGKSTLAYKISTRVQAPFNPWKDIVYTRDDVIKSLAKKRRGIAFADELINVAYNRDFYEADQKVLLKALNMYRDHCNLFIGCVPSFVDLDKQMQKLCKIRITVLRRGIALIHMRVKTLFTDDPWDVDYNRKLERKWGKGRNPRYGQLTTVKGILRFSDITKEQRRIYEEVKEVKRNRVYAEYTEGEQEDNKKSILTRLYKLVVQRQLTRDEFNKFILLQGSSIKGIRIRLNEMLRENGIDQSLQHFLLSREEKSEEDRKKAGKKKAKKFLIMRPDGKDSEDKQNSGRRGDSVSYHNKTSREKSKFWN